MKRSSLVDTDVVIDVLKGVEAAVDLFRQHSEAIILSVITVAELYAGVREGDEKQKLDDFLSLFTIIGINRKIAVKAGLYRRDFFKSHSVGLGDALIAATATAHGVTLLTLNVKHFPMLQDVRRPYRKK